MFRYLMLVLLLCCASSITVARDAQLHGANGDGGGSDVCPDQAVAASTVKHAAPISHGKSKPPATLRAGSSDDGGNHTPRWHSFLPGMFR